MSLRVIIAPAARRQMRELILWWAENRTAAAQHLPREIKRVLKLLSESPNIGHRYEDADISGVRCYRLNKTPYILYYVFESGRDTLRIVAAWSAMRGEGPPL